MNLETLTCNPQNDTLYIECQYCGVFHKESHEICPACKRNVDTGHRCTCDECSEENCIHYKPNKQ